MSNNEQQLTEFEQFMDELEGHMSELNQYLPRLHNIEYNSQSNTTSIYGHTNFEELKVNNNNVALASHTHKTDDITRDITTTIINEEEEEEEITETETLNDILDGKAEVGHNHTIYDITNLATVLDGKADVGHNHDSTYAGISHEHLISEVINLQSTLTAMGSDISGKAAYIHTHTMSEITNLSESFQALSNDISNKANAQHTHIINDITNLGTVLDGKASTSHNHDSTYAAINHTHDIDDVILTYEEEEETVNEEEETVTTTVTKTKTLSQVLNGKADTSHNHDSTYASINHTHSSFDYGTSSASFGSDGKLTITTANGWSGNNKTSLAINSDGSMRIIVKKHSVNTTRYIDCGIDSYVLRIMNTYHSTNLLTIDNNGNIVASGCEYPLFISSNWGNGYHRLLIGQGKSNNNSALIQYKATTPPTLNFGFYGNEDLLTLDTSGNTQITGTLTANGVNINSTLANKANVTHTHKTDDISRDYTTTIIYNGEEEDVTETVSLNTILDGKADLNHTHDYSGTYAAINHNHDSTYAGISHTHNFSDIKTCKGKVYKPLTFNNVSIQEKTETYDVYGSTGIIRYDDINITFDGTICNDGVLELTFELSDPSNPSIPLESLTGTFNVSNLNNNACKSFDQHDFNIKNESYYMNVYRDRIQMNFTSDYYMITNITLGNSTNLWCEDYETVTNNDANNDIEALSSLILKRVYPIGAIYTSMTNLSPAVLFGFGTWSRIENKFMFAIGNSFTDPTNNTTKTTSNQTGGEATHKLIESECPSKTWQWRSEDYHNANTNYINTTGTKIEDTTSWATGNNDYSVVKEYKQTYGGNGSHNNMPPFITVYAWQRTA